MEASKDNKKSKAPLVAYKWPDRCSKHGHIYKFADRLLGQPIPEGYYCLLCGDLKQD
jgi:hypothetical protein